MKKTYIAPETVAVQVKNDILAGSIISGGTTSTGGVTDADIKELVDLDELIGGNTFDFTKKLF